MFGYFKATCPVSPEQQQWVDARFQWLIDQFGEEHLSAVTTVLPTPEFFPDPFNGNPEEVPAMFSRVAHFMGVAAEEFSLCIYDEGHGQSFALGLHSTAGSAGWYANSDDQGESRPTIGVEVGQLADPVSLVATLAHEMAHELLLGQGRIGADEDDHEPLTDLLTVFQGFGVFTANATVRDRGWSDGTLAGWSTSRHGYLDQRMLGYALGKYAFARNESSPRWIKHVRPDVRNVMSKSLAFLSKRPGPN